jgi:hypothetical protein
MSTKLIGVEWQGDEVLKVLLCFYYLTYANIIIIIVSSMYSVAQYHCYGRVIASGQVLPI